MFTERQWVEGGNASEAGRKKKNIWKLVKPSCHECGNNVEGKSYFTSFDVSWGEFGLRQAFTHFVNSTVYFHIHFPFVGSGFSVVGVGFGWARGEKYIKESWAHCWCFLALKSAPFESFFSWAKTFCFPLTIPSTPQNDEWRRRYFSINFISRKEWRHDKSSTWMKKEVKKKFCVGSYAGFMHAWTSFTEQPSPPVRMRIRCFGTARRRRICIL